MANLSNINNKFIVADVATATRVSIGITTTNNLLTLFGTGAGNATLQIEGEGGADPYINFLANNAQHWSLGIDDSDSDKFKLSEHSALGTNDYFVVDTSGKVGIGTTNPFAKLEVTGNLSNNWAGRFENTNSIGYGILAKINSTDSSDYIFQARTGSTNVMTILGDGNVGIGTDDPDYKLQVESTSDADLFSIKSTAIANNTQMRLGISGNDSVISGTGGSTGSLVFKTYGSEKMRIDSSGNVGVGSGTPLYLLGDQDIGQIAVNRVPSTGVITDTSRSAAYINLNASNGGSSLTFHTANANNLAPTERMRITSGARINMDVMAGQASEGVIRIGRYDANTSRYNEIQNSVTSSAAGSYMNLSVHSGTENVVTDVMTLLGSGNVGIGTASPSYKLVVSNGGASGIEFSPNALTGMNEILSYNRSGAAYEKLRFSTLSYEFYTSTVANALTILNGGNVGIGTTSPASKLEVNGGVGVATTGGTLIVRQDGDTGGDGIALTSSFATSHRIWKNAAGDLNIGNSGNLSALVQLMNGNLGIGTTSPEEKLHIVNAANASVDNFMLELQNTTTVADSRSGILFSTNSGTGSSRAGCAIQGSNNGIDGTGHLLFGSVNSNTFSEKMRIDSNGSIGMGANSAAYRLRVKSDATVDNGIYLSAGTGSGNHALYVENKDGTAEFFAVRGDGEIRLNATSGHTYAAQGIRLGANASANELDDYEEGTWDPQIAMSASTISVSYSYKLGTYTKIGRMVMAMFDLNATVSGTISGFASVNGLPFTVGSSVAGGGGMAGYSAAQWRSSSLFNAGGANQQIKGFPNQNTTYIYCQLDDSGTTGFSGGAGASWKTGVAGRVTGYTMYFVN